MNSSDKKIAICFWGLLRSLRFTLPSIRQCIFKPLDDAKLPYEILLHTYTNNSAEYKLLNPDIYKVDDQDQIHSRIKPEQYMSKGNPWESENKEDLVATFNNHILSLWSLKQVTLLWLKSPRKYSHILYCRPDVTYINPIDVNWLLSKSDSIYIPNFQRFGCKLLEGRSKSYKCAYRNFKVNDRFAIGKPEQMKVYGLRFDSALEYSKKHMLHSEIFLGDTLLKHKISVKFIRFGFLRTRINGMFAKSDIKELIQKRWYTRKQANKAQRAFTRKARKLSSI